MYAGIGGEHFLPPHHPITSPPPYVPYLYFNVYNDDFVSVFARILSHEDNRSKILSPWLEDKVDSGLGLKSTLS